MLDVYLIYDRYEHNEWFNVCHIGRNYDKAYHNFINEALPDFISYGPDDCHSFQFVRIFLSQKKYYQLRKWVLAETLTREEQRAFDNFMTDIYENSEKFDTETFAYTDGASDVFAVIEECLGPRPEMDDYDTEEEYEEARNQYESDEAELYNNDEKFNEALRQYISANY